MRNVVILDAGALDAAAEGEARIRAELSLAEQLGVEVYVSSVALTETLRGHGRDTRVHAVLAGTGQQAVTPQLGRSAGELLGHTNRHDTVDAIVAVTAATLGARVRLLTADPDDLNALADTPHVTVWSPSSSSTNTKMRNRWPT